MSHRWKVIAKWSIIKYFFLKNINEVEINDIEFSQLSI